MLLGVDGGGTKTDLVVADLSGVTLATLRTGCVNHEAVGLDAAAEVLRDGVDRVLADAGVAHHEVAAAVFGLAGLDFASDEAALDERIATFGLGGVRAVVNDSWIALHAGASEGWGIVSIAGTGAVVAGRDRSGRRFRTLAVGWGEPCGAASLVTDLLHAVAAAHHGSGPSTSLTGRVLSRFGAPDVVTLFEWIGRHRVRPDGSLAPLLQLAADDDADEVAAAILTASGARHAATVVGVATRLDLRDDAFEVVTAGGVHESGGRFAAGFAGALAHGCTRATIVPLGRPPVSGAVRWALDFAAERRAGQESMGQRRAGQESRGQESRKSEGSTRRVIDQ